MKRDVIAEYRHAMQRWTRAHGGVRIGEFALGPTREVDASRWQQTPRGPRPGARQAMLGRNRELRTPSDPRDPQGDFAQALRVLQRNNKLLKAHFGVEWYEVAGVIDQEASRRGMSRATLARLMASSLRAEGQR